MVQDRKKSHSLVHQIFFIRFVACLCVVFIHAITDTLIVYELDPITTKALKNIQVVVMFATPVFVLISEFVLGFSNSKAKGFWSKRIQFILLPYLVIGFVYAIIPYIEKGFANFELVPFLVRVLKIYFPGSWHGYFVVIIFQFYILHYFFKHLLDRYSAKIMIPLSFIVNFFFLYYTNFAPHIDNPIMHWYYENKISTILVAGWIFYFVVAYYCGTHIHTFQRLLEKYRIWIFSGTVVNLAVILYLVNNNILAGISSKRVDMVLYTVFMFFTLYYIATKMKKIPHWMMVVSQTSYAIYLLHPLFQVNLLRNMILKDLNLNFGIYIAILTIIGILGPAGVAILLNRWKYGALIVGKVRFLEKKVEKVSEQKKKTI